MLESKNLAVIMANLLAHHSANRRKEGIILNEAPFRDMSNPAEDNSIDFYADSPAYCMPQSFSLGLIPFIYPRCSAKYVCKDINRDSEITVETVSDSEQIAWVDAPAYEITDEAIRATDVSVCAVTRIGVLFQTQNDIDSAIAQGIVLEYKCSDWEAAASLALDCMPSYLLQGTTSAACYFSGENISKCELGLTGFDENPEIPSDWWHEYYGSSSDTPLSVEEARYNLGVLNGSDFYTELVYRGVVHKACEVITCDGETVVRLYARSEKLGGGE